MCNKTKSVFIDGILYDSMLDAYKAYKPEVAYATFYSRAKAGKTGDSLTKYRTRPKHLKSMVIFGKEYHTVREAYDDIQPDIPFSVVVIRHRNGIRGDELFSTKRHHIRPDILINGIKFKSLQDAYDRLKPPISINVFRRRFANGLRDTELLKPSIG